MTRRILKTTVSNRQLEVAVKSLDAFTIKVENGEFELEEGTYKRFKQASRIITCEMQKQNPVRRKTISVGVVTDPERQRYLREQRRCDL